MNKFSFDSRYAKYWQDRVKNNQDGSKVPGSKIENFFIEKLKILTSDKVLDLGCGHGRLYPLLRKFSKNIYGVDVNEEVLKEARNYQYTKVSKGSAEKTKFPKNTFNKVIAWATYDVVEQNKALKEENRILKIGGRILITGKNDNYLADDKVAFIAERNAKLKNFPNHFTHVLWLIRNSGQMGFKVLNAYGFPRRGDFAKLKYFNILAKPRRPFYEFLLIMEKIGETNLKFRCDICGEFSKTAINVARKKKYSPIDFFKWHKEKYGN